MHFYAEHWNARPAWVRLSAEERRVYLDRFRTRNRDHALPSFDPCLVGFAIRDVDTRVKHPQVHSEVAVAGEGDGRAPGPAGRYLTVWQLPDRTHLSHLHRLLTDAGWHDYFHSDRAHGPLTVLPRPLGDSVAKTPESPADPGGDGAPYAV